MRKPLELLASWLLLAPLAAPAVTVTPEELNQARQWAGIRFTNAAPSRSEAPGLAGPPFGDFYPLTTWTRDKTVWMAWQFDRPDAGEGIIQVFRRESSDYESARLRLQGLDPGARYKVTNLDELEGAREFSGRELGEQGVLVTIRGRPEAVVLLYTRL